MFREYRGIADSTVPPPIKILMYRNCKIQPRKTIVDKCQCHKTHPNISDINKFLLDATLTTRISCYILVSNDE